MTKINKVEIHHTGVQEVGFPIEMTTGSAERTSKTEIIELSTAPLDPGLFELPSGFRQVSGFTDQPPPSPSSALLRLWAWVRQSLSEMLRPTR